MSSSEVKTLMIKTAGMSGIKCRYWLFPIRLGFGGLCKWLERDKVSLGAYFPSGWDLVVCEAFVAFRKLDLSYFSGPCSSIHFDLQPS